MLPTIVQLFEEQVDHDPAAIAVEAAGVQVSYGELNRRSNRFARKLRSSGVGPDTLVGLCVDRGLDMVIGLLGILKAGGAYVPLDSNYPAERLTLMIRDAAAPVIVADDVTVHRFEAVDARIVRVDRPSDGFADDDIGLIAGPDHLAYVIYTSGSTGTPKGVMISHRAVANVATWQRKYLTALPGERVLMAAPISFDASVWELCWALGQGATAVLITARELADPMRALRTASVALATLPAPLLARIPADHGLSWRLVVNSAESCRPGVADAVAPAALVNGYGPTETTMVATTFVVPRGEGENVVPIGRPIANTTVFVLDPDGERVPPGVAGELYIGGVGVARGYLGRPGLTAERFVPDPFGPRGGRLYRTGDLVRSSEDGVLEFIGRRDDQVKLRGFRIELSEVEACIVRHPAVVEVVVVAREDKPRDFRLVAYVTGDGSLSLPGLRSFVRASLPEHMVPSSIVMLDALPLSPNGKVDRRALPPPTRERPRLASSFMAPRTPVEEALSSLFASVLELESVGVDDDFFELGGHSLLVTQVVAAASSRFGVEIALSSFFDAPTVAGLATIIGAGADAGDGDGGGAGPRLTSAPHLVPLTSGNASVEPVFFVHGGEGSVVQYRDIASRLGTRPTYAFEARGIDGRDTPRRSLIEMATAYVAAMRAVQASGPYHLAGWSMGGLVALEMTRQLEAAGDTVASVVVLDTVLPTGDGGRGRLRAASAQGASEGHLALVAEVHSEAARRYVPAPVSAPVQVYLAGARDGRKETEIDQWQRICRDVEIQVVEGVGHSELLLGDAAEVVARSLIVGVNRGRTDDQTK